VIVSHLFERHNHCVSKTLSTKVIFCDRHEQRVLHGQVPEGRRGIHSAGRRLGEVRGLEWPPTAELCHRGSRERARCIRESQAGICLRGCETVSRETERERARQIAMLYFLQKYA
jgi:hypothetical protein